MVLPSFKINKRLTNAVFRYLKENDPEMFSEIANEYGRNFRMRFNNIVPEETTPIFSSQIYHGMRDYGRSPLLDLVFDRGVDLYSPEIFHLVRDELASYRNRTYGKYDEAGEFNLMTRYGRNQDVQNILNMYEVEGKDPIYRNLDSKKKDIYCPPGG